MIGVSEPPRWGPLMPSNGSDRFSRGDLAAIGVICVVWTVLAFAIDPRGDFPLQDDWAYGLPVKALTERGEIRFTDWSSPSQIAQTFWGALFSLAVGFSFTALRISTLVLGLVGLIGMYGLLRQLGAKRTVALFGAGVVGANPLYVNLSYSFMTDVPFTSMMILSSFYLIRGMARDQDVSIWVGLCLAFLSVFIRQIGLAIFFGFVLAYPFWRGLGRKWLLQALVPAVLAFVALKAYEHALIAVERLPRIYYRLNQELATPLRELTQMRLGVLIVPIPRSMELFIYLGLFTAPFSFLFWPTSLGRLSRGRRIIELGWVGGLAVVMTAVCVKTRGLMPVGGNVILDFGLGSRVGLTGEWPGKAPAVVALGVTYLSVLSAILVLQAVTLVVWRSLIRPENPEAAVKRPCVVFLITTCAFYFGPLSLVYVALFDRYFLPMVPMAIALIWLGFRTTVLRAVPGQTLLVRPIGIALGLLSLLVLLVYSAAGTHDYLDWNRERWSAARELAIPHTEIDGGWEYNNLFINEERLYKNYQERGQMMTQTERDGKIYGKILDKTYRIAVSPAPGYEVIRHVRLSPWLPLAPSELVVMKKVGASSPAK